MPMVAPSMWRESNQPSLQENQGGSPRSTTLVLNTNKALTGDARSSSVRNWYAARSGLLGPPLAVFATALARST